MVYVRIVALILALMAVGCGKARATVSGKVTFEGKPVPAGHVVFIGEDSRTASAKINEDGTYTMPGAPVGKVTILVDSRPPRPVIITGLPPGAAQPEQPKGKHVPIPDRYNQLKKSDLTYTVRKGEQTHDIVLTP